MDQSTLAQQLPPMTMWGWVGDALGRRWAMIIPAAIAVPLAPVYLLTTDFTWIAIGFVVQGAFGGALYSQLSERCPTEVRTTASAFCYHQGAIFGGFVPLVLTYFAVNYQVGLVIPMLVGTCAAATSVVIALLISPETKGKELMADLVVNVRSPTGLIAFPGVDGWGVVRVGDRPKSW
jgi:MFS transporter, SHS family, lactate transporter